MKIKLLKSVSGVGKGTIHKARKLYNGLLDFSPEYQIIEGVLMGAVIPYQDCVVISDEKTYTEKEYNDMENHYMKLLDETEKEKALLLQQIERTIDEQRVVLPKAVAEAIEFLREEGLSNYDILTLSFHTFIFEQKKLDALKKVHHFHDKELLLKALVNGYQVSENQPASLEDELKQILLEWDQVPIKDDIETDRAELARRIVKHLTERKIVQSG